MTSSETAGVSGIVLMCHVSQVILLMDKILHDPKDPKLWELWYIPYNGSCRILSISRSESIQHTADAQMPARGMIMV